MSNSHLQVLFLQTTQSFSIFSCKEYNQSDFGIDNLVMNWHVMWTLVLLEEGIFYDECVLLTNILQPLPCFILYSKAKFACYSRYLLTSYLCILVSYNEKGIFFLDVSSRRSCRSLQNYSTSASSALLVGAQAWITVILNVLSWK